MKKSGAIYIGIAALFIGILACLSAGAEILHKQMHWIENMCRII